MQFMHCPTCGSSRGFKRSLGVGTIIMIVITGGLGLLFLPLYPKRCIQCGTAVHGAKKINKINAAQAKTTPRVHQQQFQQALAAQKGTKSCPSCGEEIDIKAVMCPNCKADISKNMISPMILWSKKSPGRVASSVNKQQSIRYCRYCQAIIDPGAVMCPICKQSLQRLARGKNLLKKHPVLIAPMVIVLFLIIVGIAANANKPKDGSQKAAAEITAHKGETKEEIKTEEVPYIEITEQDPSLPQGETRLKQSGKNGVKEVIYLVTYKDGKETERVKKRGTVTVQPIPEVTLVGTKPVPKTSFSDGIYIVGTDIQPGTYKSSGGSSCYYERLSGFGGTLDEIIANEIARGTAIVTIAASDAGFKSERCGTWSLIP